MDGPSAGRSGHFAIAIHRERSDHGRMAAVPSMPRGSKPPRGSIRALRRNALFLLVVGGCEAGPSVGLDFSKHDRCTGAPPQDVDASASEIQCRVEYDFVINDADSGLPVMSEHGMNVPGTPICCEVCAVKDRADDVCESTCKYDLCSRAQDSHIAIAEDLAPENDCLTTGCGFGFQTCMDTDLLHVQAITFPVEFNQLPIFYSMQASCDAHAENAARADGLFAYLEDLDGIPGAHGDLANVDDIVAYCLDQQAAHATGEPPDPMTGSSTFPPSDGADSTGAGPAGTTGDPPDPGLPTPAPCGPWAMERFWTRPSNNFGTWNETSGGVGGVGGMTSMMSVSGGGLVYTLFPCGSAPGATCIRIDQFSAQLADFGTGLVIRLGLVEDSGLMPLSDQGDFTVPTGALRFTVEYSTDGGRDRFIVRNDQEAIGHIDTSSRAVRVDNLGVSSERGDMLAQLSLAADLTNAQPRTKIIQSRDQHRGGLVLTARTFDPDSDEVVHHWMIPGVGSWRGESISPSLPPGRHPVILFADDMHRARGVAARWVELTPSTAH